MGKIGLMGVSCVAVLAFAVMSASAAWAGIELKAGGHLLREGKAAHINLVFSSLGDCQHEETDNSVGGPNPAKKDVAIFGGAPLVYNCADEFEGHKDQITGNVEELRLSKTHKAKFLLPTPVVIEAFGPAGLCVYDFSKLNGTFPLSSAPQVLEIRGSALGKLNAGTSSGGCAKSQSTSFETTASAEGLPVEVEAV